MKNIRLILLLCVVTLTLSCKKKEDQTQNSVAQQVISEKVTAVDFKAKIENNEAQLIDVRTPGEYAGGFIKDAKNVNFYDDDFLTKMNELDKSKPVYLYCKGGGRSGKAAEQLKAQGFTKIYDLQGGFLSWQQKDLPISTKE